MVFLVESVGAVWKQLVDRGCKFIGDAREVAPNMWAATFSDPDGHHLTLFGAHSSPGPMRELFRERQGHGPIDWSVRRPREAGGASQEWKTRAPLPC